MRIALLALALAASAPSALAETTAPHAAWVSSTRGVNVRAEASRQADVIAVLWHGARVFVRDEADGFYRIDGYGVAGFAYVDRTLISETPPTPAQPTQTTAPAPR